MATLFGMFLIFNAIAGIILLVVEMSKDTNNARHNLKRFLIKFGWEYYEDDLWRQKQTGIIVSFQDAIALELQTSVHEKMVFKGHIFKEP